VLLEKFGGSDAKWTKRCLGYGGWANWSFRETRGNAVFDDPDDNQILECALSASAMFVVSGDQDSVSRYWQEIQQLICLRLEWCRRRHLLKRGTGLISFQAVGHTCAAG
jgi:hypothetical protein